MWMEHQDNARSFILLNIDWIISTKRRQDLVWRAVLKWSVPGSCWMGQYFIWGFQLKFIRSKYCVGPVPYPGRESNDSDETRESLRLAESLSLSPVSKLVGAQCPLAPLCKHCRISMWEETLAHQQTPGKLEKHKKKGNTITPSHCNRHPGVQVLVVRSQFLAVVTGGGRAAAATVVDLFTLTMSSPTPLSSTP